MTTKSVVQMMDFVPDVPGKSMDTFFLNLVERLRERGWRTVFVFAGEPAQHFRTRLLELDAPYFLATFQPTPAAAAAMGKRLRPYRPDVLQTHYMSKFSAAIPILKYTMGADVLITTDHSGGVVSKKPLLGRAAARARAIYAAMYTDYFVAVSDFIRRRDVEDLHLPGRMVRTVHMGIDFDKFPPVEGCHNEVPIVAYAGQLIPTKGVLTLLQAVQELVAEGHPRFNVRIAGAGPQEDELRRFTEANGLADRVEFLGQICWIPKLFSSADIVVVPSELDESFCMTAAEAMAAGSCLLASNAGAIPEVIGPDDSAGCIFRKGDRADLKSKLTNLLGNPDRRQRLRRAGRERAVQRFSLDRMVEGYLSVFEEIEARLHRAK